jgi:hypothetical protein
MNIWPVVRDKWNRLGVRLVIQNMWVINPFVATWEANCLRIRHSALGPSIVRIIYWNGNHGYEDKISHARARLTRVITSSGISLTTISSITSFFSVTYSALSTLAEELGMSN